MSKTTSDLISELSSDLKPVQPLAHPALRVLGWVGLALPVSLLLGALLEQQNIMFALERLQDPRILLELMAILATALTAGYAALSNSQPGRSSKVWLLPIVPFVTWLSLIGESCLQLFEQIGPDQFSFAPLWSCYPAIAATGFAPALVLVVLLRKGVVCQSAMSVTLATLAASALGAVGLRLYHAPDATVMLLMWQLIATISFMVIACMIAGYRNRRL